MRMGNWMRTSKPAWESGRLPSVSALTEFDGASGRSAALPLAIGIVTAAVTYRTLLCTVSYGPKIWRQRLKKA